MNAIRYAIARIYQVRAVRARAAAARLEAKAENIFRSIGLRRRADRSE